MEDEDQDTQTGALSQIAGQLQDAFDPSTTPEAQEYSRRILNRTLADPYSKDQSALFSDLEKNTEEARQALRDARAKLMARRYNPADAWFALAGALGAPTKTGQMGEMLANAATALRDPTQKRFEWEQDRDKQALDLEEQSAKLEQQLLALKLGQLGLTRKSDVELSKEALKTLGRRVSSSTTPDKGAQAVDRAYSKEYVDWITNGEPEASQAIGELNSALGNLQKKTNLTGPVIGTISSIPIVGKPVQDILFPKSANTQEMVESTVQRSLRPILGAQFTEKEGERLISRVYNPRLDESINAQRLQRLITKLQNAYKNKQEAAAYFKDHNTLAGFVPKHRFTINDFMPDATWPGEGGDSEEDTGSTDDNEPAQTLRPEDLPAGTQIMKLKDLPHRNHAEGGAIKVPPGKIAVQLDDGTVIFANPGATQEDIAELMAEPTATTTPTTAKEPPANATAATDEPESDSSLQRALFGAAAGAAAGYPAARTLTRAGTRLADMLPGRKETPAETRLLALMEKYNVPPADVTAGVRRAQRRGIPAMALDAGPEGFRSVAETALPEGGAQTQELLDRLTARQNASRERVNQHINQALKPDEFFTKEDELKKRLYGEDGTPSQSSQLYQDAFASNPAVKSPELFKLMDTPAGQKAVQRAIKTMKNRRQPVGRVNAMGAVTKPSLEFLNQVKIELDDMVNVAERKGATGAGKTLRDLRDSFRNGLDVATTDPQTGESKYKAARAEWEGDKAVLDALQSGRNEFDSLTPVEVQRRVGKMNFEQKDAFRSGVAQSLYESLNKPSTDINAARKLVGSPDMKSKLSALFDNPNEFKVFSEALKQEMDMHERSKGLLEQKPLIDRRATMPQGNLIQRGAQRAPSLGVFSPTAWALRWLRSKPEITPKDAADAIDMLKAQTPEELARFEQRLAPKIGRAMARRKLRGKAGMLGAGIGAITGALYEKNKASAAPDEDDPTLAGLNEEERKWATTPAKKRGGPIRFAEGGKVSQLLQMIKTLKEVHAATPMEPGPLRSAIHGISERTGTTPRLVWQMFDQPETPAPDFTRVPRPIATPQAPPPTAALEALRRSIMAEKNRMDSINSAVSSNQRLSPPQVEQITNASALANDAYNSTMENPSMESYNRLQQLVRHLADTAGMKRGGRMQSGGMTTHA